MEKGEVKKIENKGYGVVTRQDIEPGQVILCEEAAIVGPASPESCLECLRITQDFCASCGFSLCCNCQQHFQSLKLTRHDIEECQALQKVKLPNGNFKDLPGLFNIVFPMRFIQLKWTDPGLFKKLICLEGHVEDRKEQVHTSEKQKTEHSNLVNILLKSKRPENVFVFKIQEMHWYSNVRDRIQEDTTYWGY